MIAATHQESFFLLTIKAVRMTTNGLLLLSSYFFLVNNSLIAVIKSANVFFLTANQKIANLPIPASNNVPITIPAIAPPHRFSLCSSALKFRYSYSNYRQTFSSSIALCMSYIGNSFCLYFAFFAGYSALKVPRINI